MDNDISYSIINNTPQNIYITKHIDKILPRTQNIWINDNLINECYDCNIVFTFYRRKHHCRGCGKIFCHYCSSQSIYSNICDKTKLIDKYKYISNVYNREHKNRVCKKCYNIFNRLNKIQKIITLFQTLPLNIIYIYKFSLVSKLWNESSIIYLSIFREIQYMLPIQKVNNIQQRILYNNSEIILGHNKLMYKYIKVNGNKDNILDKIETSEKRLSCKELLCNVNCKNKFDHSDILDILNTTCDIVVRQYMINYLEIEEQYLLCYISFLINCIRFDKIAEPIIIDYLIKNTINYKVGINIYFELQFYSKNVSNINNYIKYYNAKMLEKDKDLIKKIVDSYNYYTLYNNNFETSKNNINKYLNDNDIYFPFNNDIQLHSIKYNSIIRKDSYTKPLIVPYNIINNNSEYLYKNAQIMYKYENMRKDRIITDIIHLIDILLKKNGLDLDIVKYNVIPISKKVGLVEIVNDSKSVFDIIENRKTSVLNYILDNNSSDTVDNIKQRFIKSTAAYCIITYLLGIGDRHLDNIMITNNGLLFHIDFTFLLGSDPKLYAPIIRIIPDMVEVIGGVNSYNYLLFKNICNKCYNILRQNTNIISNLLSLLSLDEYSINKLEKEILNRFNPGEIEQETDIYLNTTIENSKDSYNKFIDIMYYYNKKSNISSFLDYTRSFF
jgi:hypothetical protein